MGGSPARRHTTPRARSASGPPPAPGVPTLSHESVHLSSRKTSVRAFVLGGECRSGSGGGHARHSRATLINGPPSVPPEAPRPAASRVPATLSFPTLRASAVARAPPAPEPSGRCAPASRHTLGDATKPANAVRLPDRRFAPTPKTRGLHAPPSAAGPPPSAPASPTSGGGCSSRGRRVKVICTTSAQPSAASRTKTVPELATDTGGSPSK